MTNNQSYSHAAWKRLKKNKGAMFGLVIIIISLLVAVFAYFLSPDPSPNANRIILETGGNRPGFSQQFLLLKKEKTVQTPGFLKQLIGGKEDRYYYIPVNQYQIKGDSIYADKYIDEGVSEQVVYPLSRTASTPVVRQKYLLGTDK